MFSVRWSSNILKIDNLLNNRSWWVSPLVYRFGVSLAQDRGAWWAAVHGVAQSRTWLKRLSKHACIGEGNGNPLQCSCLENPRDSRAWWAAVYGVAQSQTRLKQLSSSSSSSTGKRFSVRTEIVDTCQPGCCPWQTLLHLWPLLLNFLFYSWTF